MGNVLDCSSDPLDQIHEGSDGDATTEVGEADVTARKGGPAHVHGETAGDGEGEMEGGGGRPHHRQLVYLEKAVPLRNSIMWKLQREYYTAHHVQCWERMVVPCFVTSNSFIARAYARVLVGFMRDWFLFNDPVGSSSEPIVIVEVGSGHGKFAYLVLKHLLEMREFLPRLPSSPSTAEGGGKPDGDPRRTAPESRTGSSVDKSKGEESRLEGKPSSDDGTSFSGGEANGDPKLQGEPENVGSNAPPDAGEGGVFGATVENGVTDDNDAGENSITGDLSTCQTHEGEAVESDVCDDAGKRDVKGMGGKGAGAGDARKWDGRAHGEFDGLPFRYVVTDVAQGTLDYVRGHPSMQAFLEDGLVELALLDAEDPNPPNGLHLQVSDTTVDLKARSTPVVAICNYVFDSLRQDAFRIKGTTLYENRVSITATRSLPNDLSQLSLNALEGLGLQWEHAPHAVPADRARHFYEGVDDNNGTQPPNHHHQQQPASTTTTSSSLTCAGTGAVGAEAGAVVAAAAATRGTEDDVCEPHTPPISTPKSPENPGDDKADALPTSASDEGAQNGPENGREGDGVTEARCQRDSDFDEILASYLGGDSFGREGGSLLIPLGGLRLLRHLSSLAGGRCLVLAGDKGYVSEEEMSGQRDPHIAYHGSLSCMVNLDALARYTRQRGGWTLSSPYMEGFKCQALAFGMSEEALEETRLAFEGVTQEFGPESFSTLQRAVKDEVAQPSLWLVVQLLRLSRLDPDVFMKFRAAVVQQVSNHNLAPPSWEDLKNDALAIADTWYPLQQGKDVNFEVARLLMALKDFDSAIALFRRSSSVCGEHHVTCHNMGMSYFHLGNLIEAKQCFERSLFLNETYGDSLQWLAHVNHAMEPPPIAGAPRESTGGRLDDGARSDRSVSSERPPAVLDPAGLGLGTLSI